MDELYSWFAAKDAEEEARRLAPDTGETLRESAMHILMSQGLSELDALKQIVHDPNLERTLQPEIQKRQATLAEWQRENERQAFNESPEGRAIAAKAAADAAQARAAQANQARALLTAEGHGDTSDLTDDQALRAAGITKSDEQIWREQDARDARDLAKNIERANRKTPQWGESGKGEQS
jgi:hypothetical protein